MTSKLSVNNAYFCKNFVLLCSFLLLDEVNAFIRTSLEDVTKFFQRHFSRNFWKFTFLRRRILWKIFLKVSKVWLLASNRSL